MFLCSTCDPQGGAGFDPRGILLTNLVEVPKEMLHTKYQSSRPFSFREEELKNFRSLFLCSTCDLPGWDQFWPQGHFMNKLGRGIQGDATYKISNLYTFQFQRRRILKTGFFVHMFRFVTPRGCASFDPRDIIWTNFVEVHKEMLYTKYQSSRPSSFRDEEFWSLPSLFLCSNLWPQGGASLDPKGIIWTNLVEVC